MRSNTSLPTASHSAFGPTRGRGGRFLRWRRQRQRQRRKGRRGALRKTRHQTTTQCSKHRWCSRSWSLSRSPSPNRCETRTTTQTCRWRRRRCSTGPRWSRWRRSPKWTDARMMSTPKEKAGDAKLTWYPRSDTGKRSEDWYVTQLDEEGTRGVQGRVDVAGS